MSPSERELLIAVARETFAELEGREMVGDVSPWIIEAMNRTFMSAMQASASLAHRQVKVLVRCTECAEPIGCRGRCAKGL